MVHILKHRVENRKFLEENTGGTFLTQEFDNDLGSDFWIQQLKQRQQNKIKQVGLPQT